MDERPLLHVLYTSSATGPMQEGDIADILGASRRNNAGAGVTGMLIYCDGNFIQALEGPPDAVETTMARIQRDSRHHQVIRLLEYAAPDRDFAQWAMAHASPDREAVDARLNLLRDAAEVQRRLAAGGLIGRLLGGFLARNR